MIGLLRHHAERSRGAMEHGEGGLCLCRPTLAEVKTLKFTSRVSGRCY